jgi:sorbitol-specific phosphotransferase system component IIBC
MISCVRILVLCTVAGFLLASVFMPPGGVAAGAVKGLLVGTLIAWGEWNAKRRETKEPVVGYIRH